MITSSLDEAQAPLLMVHLKVTLDPIVIPVTVEVAEDAVVIVPVPAITLHAPVPVAGVLPAKVVLVTLHKFWSAPALAVVGGAAILMVTSSVDAAQAGLLIVHRNVTLLPIVKPVNPLVGLLGLVIVAVPDVTVHTPVPIAGVFPARVAVVTLHKF